MSLSPLLFRSVPSETAGDTRIGAAAMPLQRDDQDWTGRVHSGQPVEALMVTSTLAIYTTATCFDGGPAHLRNGLDGVPFEVPGETAVNALVEEQLGRILTLVVSGSNTAEVDDRGTIRRSQLRRQSRSGPAATRENGLRRLLSLTIEGSSKPKRKASKPSKPSKVH